MIAGCVAIRVVARGVRWAPLTAAVVSIVVFVCHRCDIPHIIELLGTQVQALPGAIHTLLVHMCNRTIGTYATLANKAITSHSCFLSSADHRTHNSPRCSLISAAWTRPSQQRHEFSSGGNADAPRGD